MSTEVELIVLNVRDTTINKTLPRPFDWISGGQGNDIQLVDPTPLS